MRIAAAIVLTLATGLVHTITSPKVAAPGSGYGYGFGIRKTAVWHNGGAPGSAGELDIDPTRGIVLSRWETSLRPRSSRRWMRR